MSRKRPSRARKRVAPLAWALFFILLLGTAIGLVLWGGTVAPVPRWVTILYAVIYGGLIIGIVAALIQRLWEIEKGEEDEAAQY
ncbi:MAG: hypothetical protein E7426_03050 [Ruminococcaceae bacterium]|nr:hypothetical protein [Oscillospiraceae bacterium]